MIGLRSIALVSLLLRRFYAVIVTAQNAAGASVPQTLFVTILRPVVTTAQVTVTNLAGIGAPQALQVTIYR